MKRVVRNILNEGMMLGVHPSSQRASTTRKTKNFRILTRGNNSFVLSSVKGNKQSGVLTTNYVALAIEEYNGVAYIISAEVIDGVATGRGEIGSFPSPDYAQGETGSMTMTYRPIMNFSGDSNEYPEKNGPFNSARFNFDLVSLLDARLQIDYDGTVNIVFTDGKNPIRIINSGFVAFTGNTFKIINRNGENDSNRYTADNFDNTIQLMAKSTKIMKVDFLSSDEGGTLPTGSVQYFFSLATADGNETPIQAQSGMVPVFHGTRIADINGGRNTGDKTNKLNRLTLTNVDRSYASIVMYFVHSEGMLDEVRTAYRVDQVIPITDDEISVVHTGYEDVVRIPVSDLISTSVSIDTASTLEQIDGRLAIADVKEKLYDADALRKFSRMVTLGHKQITMDIIGPEENSTRAYNEPLNQATIKAGTDAYNGGYANPKNVYGFTGFWGGESYPFACQFILPDGVETPLFPCIGIDNVANLNSTYLDEVSPSTIDALSSTGYSTDGKMLNNRGIYRFPNRNAINQNLLFSMSGGEGRVTVNGVTFKIPALDTDLGEGKTIKDLAIGIRFFRGERRPDVMMQGMMIDAVVIPAIDYDHAGTAEKTWNYNGGNFTEENSKLVPAWGHYLETADVWDVYGGADNRSGDDRRRHGLEAFHLNAMNRQTQDVLNSFRSPFAMISGDLIVNPNAFSGVSSLQSQFRMLYNVTHKATVKTASANQTAENANHFSILTPTSISLYTGTTKEFNAKSGYAPDGLDAVNNERFSTFGRFQGRANNSEEFHLFRNMYNAYMGVRLDGNIKASEPAADGELGVPKSGMLGNSYQYTFLGNLYRGSEQRSALAVSQIYQNIDNIRYYPISQKMYFDDTVVGADVNNTLEGQLDSNRKITLFGGDCYITYSLRRLFINAEYNDPAYVDKNAVVRTGYTIGLVNEGNFNASIRSNETRSVTEGERKHPFSYGSYNPSVGDFDGNNNPWRSTSILESAGFNKGYNMNNGNIPSVTLPTNVPFIQTRWKTRVWASAKHVPNSFENGYRRFFERNYKDYPSQHGDIVKIAACNNKLYIVQEHAVGSVIIDEKIQVADASGGAVYMSTGSVLSDMDYLSKMIGSKHKNSIKATDNSLYGVDLDRGIVWSTIQEAGIGKLSELSFQSFLDEQYVNKTKSAIKILDHDIVATWNKGFNELYFTFYKKTDGVYTGEDNFTISYNETLKRAVAFMGFVPVNYFSLADKTYSMPLTDPKKIYEHDSDEVPYCNFYGVQDSSLVTYVVNPDEDVQKELQNIFISSNNVMPKSITCRVQGAKASRDLSYGPGQVRTNNCKYRKENWEITVPKITDVHHQDAEQKVHADFAGSRSLLGVGSRVKGKYIVVELYYESGNVIEIKAINSFYEELK